MGIGVGPGDTKARQLHLQAPLPLPVRSALRVLKRRRLRPLLRRSCDDAVLAEPHGTQHAELGDTKGHIPFNRGPSGRIDRPFRSSERPLGPACHLTLKVIAKSLDADQGVASLDFEPALPQLHAYLVGVREKQVAIRPPVSGAPIFSTPLFRLSAPASLAALAPRRRAREPSRGRRATGGKPAVEEPANFPRDQGHDNWPGTIAGTGTGFRLVGAREKVPVAKRIKRTLFGLSCSRPGTLRGNAATGTG